jgi:hypothetical protein
MSKRMRNWGLVVLLALSGAACAQDNSQPPAETPQGTPQPPVPAYGPDSTLPSPSENPPISGLDLPNLEPHAAPLSYLQPGAHLSEAIDSNIENSLGKTTTQSISRAEGSLDLERVWSNYDLALSYLGGVGYYNVQGVGLKQVEELGFQQKITWKRGQLGIRDAFSYQPEGTFGSSYGSVGATGAGLSGISATFGGTALGALGQVPRIMNLSLVDLVENLTPKSSVTVTGGYGFVHFLQNEPGTGTSFIGNSQASGEVGYDRVLGVHDQGALVYGFQKFQFSTGTQFETNVIQLMWGHRISGRMDFLVGAGPEFTKLDGSFRTTAAGRASLRYRFPKVFLDAAYEHYITSGSGFFAGAESDIVRLSATRPLGRIWTVGTDIGFSRNSRETPSSLTPSQEATCLAAQQGLISSPPPYCSGVSANVYKYGFAGASLRRNFGRTVKVFASYQFNDLSFDSSFCGTTGPCNRISRRNIGTIGLDWTPRPIRLD